VSYPPVSIIGKQEKFNFEDYFHNLLDEWVKCYKVFFL
jgi:hypothetical protein